MYPVLKLRKAWENGQATLSAPGNRIIARNERGTLTVNVTKNARSISASFCAAPYDDPERTVKGLDAVNTMIEEFLA